VRWLKIGVATEDRHRDSARCRLCLRLLCLRLWRSLRVYTSV